MGDSISALPPALAALQPPRQTAYSYDELIACGKGTLLQPGHARLPLPPMLMFDRITQIEAEGGAYGKGLIVAEQDIKPDMWFFRAHFEGDPVMPGCLGLDALWQLVGFFLTWCGHSGKGRALGCEEVKFSGQVLPNSQLVQYQIDLKRVLKGRLKMAIAEGTVSIDGTTIFVAKNLRVGIFSDDKDTPLDA